MEMEYKLFSRNISEWISYSHMDSYYNQTAKSTVCMAHAYVLQANSNHSVRKNV